MGRLKLEHKVRNSEQQIEENPQKLEDLEKQIEELKIKITDLGEVTEEENKLLRDNNITKL